MQKAGPLLLLIASIGFIFVGIIFSIFTNRSSATKTQDTRAKAAIAGNIQFSAVIVSFDYNSNILMVDNLKFLDNTDSKDMGTWNITAPPEFSANPLPSGSSIKITAKSTSFQVADKSLTAIKIEKL